MRPLQPAADSPARSGVARGTKLFSQSAAQRRWRPADAAQLHTYGQSQGHGGQGQGARHAARRLGQGTRERRVSGYAVAVL